MRRALALAVLAAAVFAAPAHAQEPPPEPPKIPDGVKIAGLPVGGMTGEQAAVAVQRWFDRPLRFSYGARRWQLPVRNLNARAYVLLAVNTALAAQPGTAVPLRVRLDAARIRAYVGLLDRGLSRRPRNSVLYLRYLRPYITRAVPGVDVSYWPMAIAITRAVNRTYRGPILLRYRLIRPTVTRLNYGPVVVVRRDSRRLYLYNGMRYVAGFRVAVGMPRYPTPIGRFRIIRKERNPTWNPPDAPWAAGAGPIPPGPGNPLGTRWMGLSAPGIGIHGTYAPSSSGTAASHGCIRMYIRQSEWLYDRVRLGTTVFIVRA